MPPLSISLSQEEKESLSDEEHQSYNIWKYHQCYYNDKPPANLDSRLDILIEASQTDYKGIDKDQDYLIKYLCKACLFILVWEAYYEVAKKRKVYTQEYNK